MRRPGRRTGRRTPGSHLAPDATMRRARDSMRLAVWLGLLAASLRLLLSLDSGPLRGPSLRHWTLFWVWVATHDPVTTGFVAVRVMTAAACAYLLVVTLLGALARLVRAPGLARAVDGWNVAVLRGALTAALGAGLTVGGLAAPAQAAAGPPRPSPAATRPEEDPPVMRRLPDAPVSTTSTLAPTSTSMTTSTTATTVPDDTGDGGA